MSKSYLVSGIITLDVFTTVHGAESEESARAAAMARSIRVINGPDEVWCASQPTAALVTTVTEVQ
jgi:hypothetical protein